MPSPTMPSPIDPAFSIRPAQASDIALIHALVRELAAYEKLTSDVDATPAMLEAALFGAAPRVFSDIAERAGTPVGFCVWFYSFSTFRGRHGIWLEDLFVRPDFRGRGFGKALLAQLAARCVRDGLSRLEWAVLDWNAPAIGFYEAMGARLLRDWTQCRMDGEALARLGTITASPETPS